MKYKAILLDYDGVISPSKLFSDIYAKEFGINVDVMKPFFEDMKQATLGKADLKKLLNEVLDTWQWRGTVDELIDYWMHADSNIDERFIGIINPLRENNVKVYLATDQEKYRAEFIWNQRRLRDWLDGRFVSFELGYQKNDKKFFETIIGKLNINPTDILFFDDSQSKVDSARKVGIDAYLYTDFESFKKVIQKL